MNVINKIKLLIFLLFIILIFSLLNPNYFSLNNLFGILISISVTGLVCLGQGLCIITGGFDFSVNGVALMSGVVAAYLISKFDINVWIALLIVLVLGTFIGFLNALIITKGNINPLIITLSMGSILTGLSFFMTHGSYINVKGEIFRILGTYRLFNIKVLQIPVVILAAMVLILLIILTQTSYGRFIYAVGGNKIAAGFSGIKVNLISGSAYLWSGFLSALAGYITASRIGSAQPGIGSTLALFSVTAVILGGVSFKGGRGSILGAVIGITIIQCLNIGLRGLGLPIYYQELSIGLVLILAVYLDSLSSRRNS